MNQRHAYFTAFTFQVAWTCDVVQLEKTHIFFSSFQHKHLELIKRFNANLLNEAEKLKKTPNERNKQEKLKTN